MTWQLSLLFNKLQGHLKIILDYFSPIWSHNAENLSTFHHLFIFFELYWKTKAALQFSIFITYTSGI